MTRHLLAAVMSIALLGSTVALAETPREWNEEHEGPAYRAYLKEHHKKAHEWAKASKKEQRDYWKWRDAHQGEYH